MKTKILSQIGEIALLKRIQKLCRKPKSPISLDYKIHAPIGDDAFVANLSSNFPLAFTTDTLIEGTHFNLDCYSSFLNPKEVSEALAHKAIAVNLSDFAAMGEVKPLLAFITLGLNGDISVDFVDNLYTKMLNMAKTYGFNIAGGDIIQSEKSIISVFLVGKYGSKRIICRSGAKKGDILMVSGPLGLSALGLNIMKNQLKSALKHDPTFGGTVDLDEKKLIYTHLFPEPKLKEGKILANDDILATSLMDTSDDLMSSLEILAQESRVGFEVNLEKAPLSPLLISVSQKMGCSPYEFFLYGGEDYQLLFTVLPRKAALVKKKIPSAYVIGEVKSRSFGIQIKMQGNPFRIKDTRFRHF